MQTWARGVLEELKTSSSVCTGLFKLKAAIFYSLYNLGPS